MSPFLGTAPNLLLRKRLRPCALKQMDSRVRVAGYLASVRGRRKFFGAVEYSASAVRELRIVKVYGAVSWWSSEN